MDTMTRLALKASIEHWKNNARVRDLYDARLGPAHCALCEMFRKGESDEDRCAGCPVYEYTGYRDCRETPYDDAADAYEDGDFEIFRIYARREVEFLEKLLPKADTK